MNYPKPGPRVNVLTHPNIPKPLHGISPRTVYGQAWWDAHRKEAYAHASQTCEACLTPRNAAWPQRWLEAHEMYEYRSNGTLVFKDLVALCPACHKFIHSGLRGIMLQQGTLSKRQNQQIETHGYYLLKKAGLLEKWKNRHEWCSDKIGWPEFRMIIGGKSYGPSTRCMSDWARDEWRNWKPSQGEN
jgi:hypothetical protein